MSSLHHRHIRRALGGCLLAVLLAACSDSGFPPTGVASPTAFPSSQTSASARAILFGPQRFTRHTAAPTTESVVVAGANFASFEGPFVLKLQNGADDGSLPNAAAWIWLDDVLLYGPDDFSPRVSSLEREITLQPGSVLKVRLASQPESFLTVQIEGQLVAGRAQIGMDGGEVSLDDLASMEFPAGFFPSTQTVEVTRTEDATAMAQFIDLESLFRVSSRTTYQVRLLTGTTAPIGPTFTATLTVPTDLPVAAGHRPELFVQFYEAEGMAVLDNFQLIESAYDPVARAITATILSDALTNHRRADGQYEALFMIAATPGGATTGGSSAVRSGDQGSLVASMTMATASCQAGFIGRPLPESVPVTSHYGQRTHPVTGEKGKMHWGTDFGASTGTTVGAAADGTVQRVWNSATYGLTMIVRHTDGSATLYAHLQTTGANVGDRVTRGAPIATTNGERGSPTAGTSTGPHLHFEYVPNGEIVQSKGRIDPFPCMQDQNASGSLTVRDNGSLADDAFAVYLNGTLIGQTAIGASNTIALNNIRIGTHTLTITGIVVPDNVGTYEVILASGITFADGGTRRSGVVPLGGSAAFTINVPDPATVVSTAQVYVEEMQPNAVQEGPSQ